MTRAGISRLPLIALALGLATPALAQESAAPVEVEAANDPRLVTETFDESRVFTIAGKTRVQTTIKFGPDESIQNVAIGDSAAWQVQPNQAQSILFVKPLEANARTNLTVVTSKRTYLFDLISSPRNQPLYVLQFRYPELEAAREEAERAAAEAAANPPQTPSAIELAAANDPYAVSDPASLNFAWTGEGDANLLPSRTYDNGDAVFLTWPEGTAVPAILVTNHDGDEGPVNFTVRGETIVLDSVPDRIILTAGGDRAILTNANSGARGS